MKWDLMIQTYHFKILLLPHKACKVIITGVLVKANLLNQHSSNPSALTPQVERFPPHRHWIRISGLSVHGFNKMYRPLWYGSFWGTYNALASLFYSLRPPPEPPVFPQESKNSCFTCVVFNLFFCLCIWWTVDKQCLKLFLPRWPAAFQI